ncbi:ER membrane glycoprotein subunit of the GPI transamidase complex-like protein [Serendipita sp. 411]|nr:ER membrane glycoprotein subunit of the GPI transamidase complex-like protein [Serendipita sp. 411]
MFCITTKTLYELTLLESGSQQVGMLATACSLLVTSPAALLHAPYAEPFFTFLSYKGLLQCAHKNWLRASLYFMLACCFRSNGALLVGYIVWGMIIEPLQYSMFIKPTTILYSILLCCLIVSPIVFHQASGYYAFCMVDMAPDWCQHRTPLIYTHVQSTYWDVGLFKYWTIAQSPNFLIATPPLALLFWASWTHMKRRGFSQLAAISDSIWLGRIPYRIRVNSQNDFTPLVTDRITPHAIYAMIFSLILIFSSHIQIVLRLAASMPFTYWAAARLWIEHPKTAKIWATWSVLWAVISLTAWGLFLPPA